MECTGDHLPSPVPRSDLRNRHSRAKPKLVSPIASGSLERQAIRPCPCSPGDPLTEHHAEAAQRARERRRPSQARPPIARRRPGAGGRLHPAGGQVEHRRPYGDRFRAARPGRSRRWPLSLPTRSRSDLEGASGSKALPAADWVLIDADDVIVHLFRPEVRTFYNLERMWAFGDEATISAARRVRAIMRFIAIFLSLLAFAAAPAAAASSPDLATVEQQLSSLASEARRTSASPRSTSTPARASASRATRRSRWRAPSRSRSRRSISRRSIIARRRSTTPFRACRSAR